MAEALTENAGGVFYIVLQFAAYIDSDRKQFPERQKFSGFGYTGSE